MPRMFLNSQLSPEIQPRSAVESTMVVQMGSKDERNSVSNDFSNNALLGIVNIIRLVLVRALYALGWGILRNFSVLMMA